MFRIGLQVPSEQASGHVLARLAHTRACFLVFLHARVTFFNSRSNNIFDGEPALPRVGQSCGVDVQNAKHGNDMLRDLRKGLKSKTRRRATHSGVPSLAKDILGPEAFQVWWRSAYGDNDQPRSSPRSVFQSKLLFGRAPAFFASLTRRQRANLPLPATTPPRSACKRWANCAKVTPKATPCSR